jgi:CRISPR-associated protein Cas2
MSRFMRLIVFFDLPVVEVEARRRYTRFRRFLLNDGYDMIQFSVYARICNGQDAVNRHVGLLAANVPELGSVRYIQVTEKQFAGIQVLAGKKKVKEDTKFAGQLSFF